MNEKEKLHKCLYSIFFVTFIFICLCFFALLYISKDNTYSNTIYKYFHIRKEFHLKLTYQNISKEMLVNLINFSIIAFFASNYYFLYKNFDLSHKKKILKILSVTLWIIELIYTSTYFYRFIYLATVNCFISASLFRQIDDFLLFLFRLLNFAFWGQGIIFYFKSRNHYSSIKEVRRIIYLSGILNVFIFILFTYMFGYFPQRLIWISKVASFHMFNTMKLPEFIKMMEIIPFIILFILCLLIFLFIKYMKTISKINTDSYIFENIISASNISIKIFAHYIKNELLGIISGLNALKEKPESKNEDIEEIKKTCNTIYEHLNLLQKNTKKIILEQQKIDIVNVLKDYLLTNEQLFHDNKVQIISKIPDSEIFIFGDQFYLNEVLSNITINSIDALNERNPDIKTISYAIKNNDDFVFICITDNGSGIMEDHINKVFEPFVSTKVTRNNWGIGLSFVKRIIDNHYGTISLENINPGLSVTIKLPVLNGYNEYKKRRK